MATKNFPFSDGRSGVFFQDTSVPNQPVAPIKGNLQGAREKAASTIAPSKGKRIGKGYETPNQETTNGPPKSANWQSTRNPRAMLHGKKFKP